VSGPAPVRTVGLLLAAGSGSRFDADAPGQKLLEAIDGRTLVEHSLIALAAAVDVVVVVTRREFQRVQDIALAHDVQVVIAADAALGMGHSLAAGIRAVVDSFPDLTTVVVALADMPWVRAATIAELAAQCAAHRRVAQPVHDGQRGNPVAFPSQFLERLAASAGDSGARQLLREQDAQSQLLLIETDDPGVLRDVDVRGDLPRQAS